MFRKANMIMPFACLLAFFICTPARAATLACKTDTAVAADSVTGEYVDGKKEGIWRTFSRKTGFLVKRERYKNGVLIYYTIYNEKRRIIETRDRKGRVTHYNPCNC